MTGKKAVQNHSQDQLFFSLKETVSLGTKEFAKTVGKLFHADKSLEQTDPNQISLELEKREKALQNSRI